ncbi:MAG TPA: outer membrane beta-barrel family protein [Flavobacterium sp.]|nr:outer membrane beta-barrel family protein [Flavobacterium sp.]
MKSIQIIVFSLISLVAFAQQTHKISGKVYDKANNLPLEYSIVYIKNTQNPSAVFGGTTDAKGAFAIDVPTGNYNIKIDFMSFKPYEVTMTIDKNTELGNILLDTDSQMIEGVEIIAERSTVELRLDKRIYNVGQDMMVKGGTISDVLDNVPSVSVDVDGTIMLRGDTNVKILIDGKPSGLAGININDALKMLPADSVEKIEVITNPSSRYEAEGGGGIINIILRKGKSDGVNGSFTITTGDPANHGISANVNHKTEDFNIYTTQSYNQRGSKGNFVNDIENLNPTTGDTTGFLKEDRQNERLNKGYTGTVGVDWNLTDSFSWRNSLTYRKDNGSNPTMVAIDYFDPNMALLSQSSRDNYDQGTGEDVDYSTGFIKKFSKEGHQLSADFSTAYNKNDNLSNITTKDLTLDQITRLERTANVSRNSRNTVMLDYVLPIGKNTQFEAGYRGNFSDVVIDYKVENFNQGTNQWENDANYSNILGYKENVNALYTQLGSKFGKFSVMGGLRWEDTNIDIDQRTSQIVKNKRYDNLFPSIFFSYELNEEANLSLSYSKRVSRPRSYFINPFSNLSSNVSLFRGNPDLDPAMSNAFDLGFLKRWGNKVTLSTSMYFNHTTDAFQFIRYVEEINNIDVLVTSPVNLGIKDRFGFEFTLNYNPFKWWRLNGNFNLYRNETKGDYTYYDLNNNMNTQNFDNVAYSWFSRITSKITLPYKIDWQTNATYRAPEENAQGRSKGILSANLAFSKDLLNDKATISLNVSDVFNSRKRISETELLTQNSYSEMQWRERQITLSFTYRFNKKKDRERPLNGGGYGEDEFMGG